MRALLLALVAAPLVLAQPASLSIEGTVASEPSGAVLAGARIVISTMGSGHTLAYSDSAGRFRCDGLRATPYNLVATRTGYLQAAQLVDLTPGRNSTGVRISLAPQAVIAGTVEDQDGFPVNSASIIVLARGAQGEPVSRGNSRTDDRGRFRAAGLAPGRYYLHVEPGMARTWDASYTDVYYPGATRFEDAEAIEVAAGQVRSGVVVGLTKSGGVRVQGRVAMPSGFAVQQGSGRAQVMLATIGAPGFGRTTYIPLAEDGSFTIKNVQPGKYRIQASLPPPYSRAFPTGPEGKLEPNLIVGTGDIAGLVVKAEDTRPLDLPGKVLFDAGTPPARVVVTLTQHNEVQARTTSQGDGSFVLRAVQPGLYRLAATTIGGAARGISAKLGEAGLPYGNLEVKGPHPGPLVIAMSSAMARIWPSSSLGLSSTRWS